MKKSRLLYLAGFVLLSGFSHSQDILWEKSYGGLHAEYLMDAIPTADYGFILAGSSLSNKTGNKSDNNKGDLDYWIWKMNENGDLDWQKSFGGAGSDLLQSITITHDGGFLLGGVSSSNKSLDKKEDAHGDDDFWVIKLNAQGGEEWQTTLGGAAQEKLHCIQPTRDGGYILGGSSASDKSHNKADNSFGNMDFWVVKLDHTGNVLWQKTYGGKFSDEVRSIITTIDGGYLVAGYSNSPASGNKRSDGFGEGDYWLLKLDAEGLEQWQKVIGGSGDEQLAVVRQTYDGNYVLGGSSNSEVSGVKTKSNGEGSDFWVLKINAKGELIWQETYNYGRVDVLTSLVENDDHTLVIGGFAKGEYTTRKSLTQAEGKAKKGTDDYIALKISENGQELWSETVGSDGEDVLKKVIETRDGGYLFAGTGSPTSVSSAAKGAGNKLGGLVGKQNNEYVDQQVRQANSAVKEQTDQATQKVNDTYNQGAQQVRETLGIKEDSPLKLASNPLSAGVGLQPRSAATTSGSAQNSKPIPSSRDKKKNLGRSDFWVVKLLDKTKTKEEKKAIEAFPNPATSYTNVIVGYEFETGTATLVDLAGRQLQQFEISSRTVPVNLEGLPEGIYVVNIKTNDGQSNGIKVMKTVTKNK